MEGGEGLDDAVKDAMFPEKADRIFARLLSALCEIAAVQGFHAMSFFSVVFAGKTMEEENQVDGLLLFDVSGEQAVFPVQKGEFPIFPCDVAQCRTAMDDAGLILRYFKHLNPAQTALATELQEKDELKYAKPLASAARKAVRHFVVTLK